MLLINFIFKTFGISLVEQFIFKEYLDKFQFLRNYYYFIYLFFFYLLS
jgi:hypothetical protein